MIIKHISYLRYKIFKFQETNIYIYIHKCFKKQYPLLHNFFFTIFIKYRVTILVGLSERKQQYILNVEFNSPVSQVGIHRYIGISAR